MPFGHKKSEKDDLEVKKSSLFSSRSKSSKAASPAPPSANPYAVPPASNDPSAARNTNPYANQNLANDPYAPKSQSSLTQPPVSSFGSLSLNSERGGAPPSYGNAGPQPNRYEKSPVPTGGYGAQAPKYQSQGSYGQSGGYGSDPYGSGQSRYGAGGYGGLGRSNSQDTMSTEAGHNALFGDAAQRAAQQQQQLQVQQQDNGDTTYNNNNNNSGGYSASEMAGGYGASADRELTAEEQEEQEVDATKQEIRYIKQQDVASLRNARRIAEQAEQTGRETLARLGQQGERIHNTERNLDMASNQNRLAEEKARELKTLNRSMFAVHVSNPFTAKAREEAANAIALEKNQRERAQRDATAAAAYSSQARQQKQARDINGNLVRTGASAKSLADRAKYQFEADSEDDEMENEIDESLDALHRGAKTLGMLGKAMGDEIDRQNEHILRITKKTDKVDDQIAVNRARLDRIK